MRLSIVLLVCAAAACGAPQAQHTAPSSARITEAGANGPHPFPTIEASTLADLKNAACGWARTHFRAPHKASANTPVIYRELIGDPDFASENAPPGLGFRDTYLASAGIRSAAGGTPQSWADAIAAQGVYHVRLIDRRDANADLSAYCPTNARQVSYLDGSLMSVEGGAQQVCVNVQRASAPAHAETLERFEHIAISSGRYSVVWSGDRWSGEGGALVAVPTFRMPSEEYTGEADLNCPGVSTEGFTSTREYDRRAWRLDLAPTP